MSMIEKIYRTEKGPIHYWISSMVDNGPSLIFLPGLTADHRLFEKQTEYFDGKYRMFVWDAPGHASSYPFQMNFSLADKAKWLDEIIELEGLNDPVIIGQSMGGYAGQMYSQLFPEKLRGFISIDSAPLQRQYLTGAEAIEADLPYEIKCPALLICGDKDHARSCIRYNKKWHKRSGIKIEWIKGAGHNSNTDEPEQINKLIERFVKII